MCASKVRGQGSGGAMGAIASPILKIKPSSLFFFACQINNHTPPPFFFFFFFWSEDLYLSAECLGHMCLEGGRPFYHFLHSLSKKALYGTEAQLTIYAIHTFVTEAIGLSQFVKSLLSGITRTLIKHHHVIQCFTQDHSSDYFLGIEHEPVLVQNKRIFIIF